MNAFPTHPSLSAHSLLPDPLLPGTCRAPQPRLLPAHGKSRSTWPALGVALTLALGAASARADERLFTYSYEADVLPKGGVEFEQWITHRNGKDHGIFARWDFREELEYGLTEKLTTALYLNTTSTYTDGVPGFANGNRFEFDGVSSEWKYQILNPFTSPLGLLVYGEGTYSGKELELEEKVVLQHNFGEKWTLAFNGTVEQEWEFEADKTERELTLDLSAGLGYRFASHWAVGLEFLNQRSFGDYGPEKSSAYFVGPALHYGSGKWWATLTVLPQVLGRPETRDGLNLKDYERIQVRLIAGFNF